MLKNTYVLNIKLKLLSGMYIGAGNESFDIGGADSQVVKNPLTKVPYIPGSSMKGKLKSLLKYKHGQIKDNDITLKDGYKKVFEPVDSDEIRLTRGIFRDFNITEESKREIEKILGTGIYTEVKAENRINAIKGKADSPRFIERVPAGTEFEGEIVLNEFDGDNIEEMKNIIKEALNLLEYNYIGGSGSRGYGKVAVEFADFELKDF